MGNGSSRWHLVRFTEELDLWVERAAAPADLVLLILPWIMSRIDDPYRGVRRAAGFDNLWFGPIPGTDDGSGRVVSCSYWITETSHSVRCNSFSTLHRPL